MVENFQYNLAVPNIKYNCAVLFLKEMYWLFINACKYSLIYHDCKILHRIN